MLIAQMIFISVMARRMRGGHPRVKALRDCRNLPKILAIIILKFRPMVARKLMIL
jgi:hypothetical protein